MSRSPKWADSVRARNDLKARLRNRPITANMTKARSHPVRAFVRVQREKVRCMIPLDATSDVTL